MTAPNKGIYLFSNIILWIALYSIFLSNESVHFIQIWMHNSVLSAIWLGITLVLTCSNWKCIHIFIQSRSH